MMRLCLAACAAALAACAGNGGDASEQISIAYDPASETAADAAQKAHEYCLAFGKSAEFVDETIDADGRLRRRHFHCR